MDELKVLCGANFYEEKYYLNPAYEILPQAVKDELKIMCVLFVQDVSGIIVLEFDDLGNLRIIVTHGDSDQYFDEIGSKLKISQIRMEKRELFEQLENYYKVISGGQ